MREKANTRLAAALTTAVAYEDELIAPELRQDALHEWHKDRAAEAARLLTELGEELNLDKELAVAVLSDYSRLLRLVLEDLRHIHEASVGSAAGEGDTVMNLSRRVERGLVWLTNLLTGGLRNEDPPAACVRHAAVDVQEVATIALELLAALADNRENEEGPEDETELW